MSSLDIFFGGFLAGAMTIMGLVSIADMYFERRRDD